MQRALLPLSNVFYHTVQDKKYISKIGPKADVVDLDSIFWQPGFGLIC